jgi:predicted  nucleic acid-binding Zn-ribbon protein
VAYSKLKEEMFMDYAKFNALYKAKEYEHSDLIKNQKHEIDTLMEQLKTASLGLDGIMEQNKQLTYELNRTKNELANKEVSLSGAEERLRLITKKYNEQAE